jgi:hypothetical protein
MARRCLRASIIEVLALAGSWRAAFCFNTALTLPVSLPKIEVLHVYFGAHYR